MAQRRLLNRSLGTSKKYYRLNERAGKLADFCQALFALIIPNCDDHGRFCGDAFSIKLNVFPVSKYAEADFEEALQALHDESLISLYEVGTGRFLYVHNFRREQPGIHYVAEPVYPEPPPEVFEREQFTGTDQISPDFSRREEKRSEKKRSRKNMRERRK
jgi:hypothetical protein